MWIFVKIIIIDWKEIFIFSVSEDDFKRINLIGKVVLLVTQSSTSVQKLKELVFLGE